MMEDKLIGLLVTLVIIVLVVGYILSAVGAAIQATLDFFAALWQSGYLAVQELLAWLGSWPGSFEWPAIELPEIGWPTFPAGTGTPPARARTPVAGGILAPGGQAEVANTGGDRLNCRADAAVNSGVVTKLDVGAGVTLIQSRDNAVDGYTWWQVTTSDNVTCWVAANWLLPVAAPLVTPTIAPVPTAIPTLSPGDGIALRGRVLDGLNHPLVDVRVDLWAVSTGKPDDLLAHQYTGNFGEFNFQELDAENEYRVAVVLIDRDGKTPVYFGNNSTDPVQVSTLAMKPGTEPVIIDFSNKDLTASDAYKDNLVDLAAIYYHFAELKRFVRITLKYQSYTSLDFVRPFYSPHCGGNSGVYNVGTKSLTIYTDLSGWAAPGNPVNREWHEGSHHLMNSIMPQSLQTILSYYTRSASAEGSNCPNSPTPTPTTTSKLHYENHGGYENWNSGDSWAEGWAEFWPCVAKSELDGVNGSCIYVESEKIEVNLETNWKIYDKYYLPDYFCEKMGAQCAPLREEYVVASLLWDLYDPKNTGWIGGDGDNVDLSAAGLWEVFERTQDGTLTNMYQVYGILHAWANFDHLINEDGTLVSTDDIDQIFKNHGFCADKNENHQCDSGETVGYAGWKNGAPRE